MTSYIFCPLWWHWGHSLAVSLAVGHMTVTSRLDSFHHGASVRQAARMPYILYHRASVLDKPPGYHTFLYSLYYGASVRQAARVPYSLAICTTGPLLDKPPGYLLGVTPIFSPHLYIAFLRYYQNILFQGHKTHLVSISCLPPTNLSFGLGREITVSGGRQENALGLSPV